MNPEKPVKPSFEELEPWDPDNPLANPELGSGTYDREFGAMYPQEEARIREMERQGGVNDPTHFVERKRHADPHTT